MNHYGSSNSFSLQEFRSLEKNTLPWSSTSVLFGIDETQPVYTDLHIKLSIQSFIAFFDLFIITSLYSSQSLNRIPQSQFLINKERSRRAAPRIRQEYNHIRTPNRPQQKPIRGLKVSQSIALVEQATVANGVTPTAKKSCCSLPRKMLVLCVVRNEWQFPALAALALL